MKKAFTWFILMTKRQLKRASTIAIIIGMLLSIIAMKLIPTSINASLTIGYCASDIHTALKDGMDNHEGILRFVAYEDDSSLENDVTSGTIQGGYIFSEDLSSVEAFRTPDNAVSLLSDVVVLALVMEYTADDMLVDDILNQNFFQDMTDEDIEHIKETYKKHEASGSTFSFDYNTLYEDYKGSSSEMNIAPYLKTPVRGIIAIFIYVAALAAGVGSYSDAANHIYANIPLKRRHPLKLLNISIPSILSGIVGFIGILVVGIGNHILYEFCAITVYTLMCIVFSYILTYLIKKDIYFSLIPVFILGSVVCCPIFFNLGNLIPAMKIMQQLFLPTYYFTIFF